MRLSPELPALRETSNILQLLLSENSMTASLRALALYYVSQSRILILRQSLPHAAIVSGVFPTFMGNRYFQKVQ